MTDEELDRAIVAKALDEVMVKRPGATFIADEVATLALRLKREGWMPPDPLEAEMKNLFDRAAPPRWSWTQGIREDVDRIVRMALERGIELGKSRL